MYAFVSADSIGYNRNGKTSRRLDYISSYIRFSCMYIVLFVKNTHLECCSTTLLLKVCIITVSIIHLNYTN